MEQIVSKEKYTSIHKAQAGLTKLLKEAEEDYSFYRVMRNDAPVGVLMPNRTWEAFLEDIEALNSTNYLNKITRSRKEKKKISLSLAKKKLGL